MIAPFSFAFLSTPPTDSYDEGVRRPATCNLIDLLTRSMNVGIFGGTFNPPHLAHLVAAEAAREQFDLERVLWIPSRVPPHRERPSATPEQRLAMTRLATDEHAAFIASDLEMQRSGPSYTVDTVRHLQDEHPDTNFALILGGDSLRSFHAWRAPEEIARRVSLVAYRRALGEDEPPGDEYVWQALFVDAPRIDISSTGVRERCSEGRSIRYLVPPPVDAYIHRQRLYETAAPPTAHHL